ncbi:MAG: serine hydrolase domain-containing protein, partial [Planctomycetota bacterium]
MIRCRARRLLSPGWIGLLLALSGCRHPLPAPAASPQAATLPPSLAGRPGRSFALAMSAKAIASAVFVEGRDPAEFVEHDLKTDSAFTWWEGVSWRVDRRRQRVTLTAPDTPARTAVFHQGLGCTLLPEGKKTVFFQLVVPRTSLPPAETLPWPMGDRLPPGPALSAPARQALEAALDFAFDDEAVRPPHETRAVVVVRRGRLIAERYAPGFEASSRLVGWSMGKSIGAALAGVLVGRGALRLEDPAPVEEWRSPGDPRARITVADLLHMSSGLGFKRLPPGSWTPANDHFYVYFGAIDVFAHSASRPPAFPPGKVWRYRNCDPLLLAGIVRRQVEASGEEWLSFPRRSLFDPIGARSMVLEPDPYGNFILTGYDYGTARDWARFGLLHLQEGVFDGKRVLPAGWVDFVRAPAPADPSRGYGGLFWL